MLNPFAMRRRLFRGRQPRNGRADRSLGRGIEQLESRAVLSAGGSDISASNIVLPPNTGPKTPEWVPQAGIVFATVGHPGNAPDVTGLGAVPYEYRIGSIEVSNLAYTRFLNAVAATDTYGLYDARMTWSPTGEAGIVRTGEPGGYVYSVPWTTDGFPVAYVNWHSAARFANWMHNGALPGGDTESGAYALNGATSGRVSRSAEARVWIPTENEWYKAAYFSPTYRGPTLIGSTAGYWRYPTQSNDVTPQTAVYSTPEQPAVPKGGLLAGVGVSALGTYNQGGNVWEYLDADPGSTRWLRGGGAGSGKEALASYTNPTTFQYEFGSFGTNPPDHRESDIGFRLAAAPVNPTPLTLSLSSTTITENNAIGAVVGRLTTGTLGPGETPQYAIFSDNGKAGHSFVEIVDGELRARQVFDYEHRSYHSFWVVAAVPGREPVVEKFSITVENAPDPITEVVVWDSGIQGTRIGVLRAFPVDAAAARSFTLLPEPGTDSELFAINGDELVVVSKDFRPNTSYRIRVRANDGLGTTLDADLTVMGRIDEPIRAMRALDLGDIVAGRDGFGGPVTGIPGIDGINPATGEFTLEPLSGPVTVAGYKTVAGPLIDGVFVVNNGDRRTTITSTGATFSPNAVLATSFDAITHARQPGRDAPLMLDRTGYRSGVAIMGSAGITFDLREIALRHGGLPTTFTAHFGNMDELGSATSYVILSDERGFGGVSTWARVSDKPVKLQVNLYPWDRFLTLVSVLDSPVNASRAVFAAATIELLDGPSAPLDIGLSKTTVAENAPANAFVAALSTVDVNAGDSFTYELVAAYGGDVNANFRIVGNRLRTAAVLDRETQGSQWVRVRATDSSGLSTERAFEITVTDVPEAPTGITLSKTTVAENRPANALVAALTAIDPDVGDTHTFELVSGPGSADNGRFVIVGQKLRAIAPLDFETQASHSVRLRATDATGRFIEQVVVVNVIDVDEPAAVSQVMVPADGAYGPGAVLSFTIVTTQAVSLVGPGRPEIPLMIGSRKSALVFQNTGPGNRLTFTYTVQPKDPTRSGMLVAPTIRLPVGTVFRTASGGVLPTALPTIDGSRLRIDTTGPGVADVAGPSPGDYVVGAVLAFVVRFTEAVTASGQPVLPVTIGKVSREARYVLGSGTSELVFHYTVQPGDLARSGIATGKALVLPAGAVIRDAAGNRATLSLRQQRLKTVRVGP